MVSTTQQINNIMQKIQAGLTSGAIPQEELKKHYKKLEPARYGRCSKCLGIRMIAYELREPANKITDRSYQLLKEDYKTTQYLCKDCATLDVL